MAMSAFLLSSLSIVILRKTLSYFFYHYPRKSMVVGANALLQLLNPFNAMGKIMVFCGRHRSRSDCTERAV